MIDSLFRILSAFRVYLRKQLFKYVSSRGRYFALTRYFRLTGMFNFLFTVVLFRFPCVTGQHQRLIQGDHGLKRSSFQHGLSYANFKAHKFQHLQGSLLDSSCEVARATECSFACVANAPCVSYNLALSPNENGKLRCELLSEDKFRSPDKLTDSQQFHHYSIKVLLII